ncbi:MAG: hypothetical protein IPH77_13355 [Ignavibacteria bacterium]|nr:hypothetical protein [Ignavibacteria bacterium]
MAKNKSNINLHNIEDLKDSFSEFLYNHIFTSNEEIKFINKLLEKDDLLIFGGVIKDFLLAIRESKEFYDIDFKDIDLVATNIQDEIKEFLNDYSIRVNVFGGFKLKLDNKDYDLWEMENTWAFKEFPQLGFDLENYLPKTSFFNSTAILYSIKKNEFIFERQNYEKFYVDNELDIVLESNPYPELCIVKSYDYYYKHNVQIAKSLRDYILKKYRLEENKLEQTQVNYYGK